MELIDLFLALILICIYNILEEIYGRRNFYKIIFNEI